MSPLHSRQKSKFRLFRVTWERQKECENQCPPKRASGGDEGFPPLRPWPFFIIVSRVRTHGRSPRSFSRVARLSCYPYPHQNGSKTKATTKRGQTATSPPLICFVWYVGRVVSLIWPCEMNRPTQQPRVAFNARVVVCGKFL